MKTPEERAALERFRIEYELKHGPVDLTRRYTCTWPTKQQEWMFAHETEKYFAGLPDFVQAYLLQRFHEVAAAGQLDELPVEYIRLFVGRHMKRPNDRGTSI
ncbi:MAG: hypothetical protein QM783_15885 [Phycisphaerales bacterium]